MGGYLLVWGGRRFGGWLDLGALQRRLSLVEEREQLNWNPVDGKHAEKQQSVRNLKAMFDVEKKDKQ